VHPEHWPVDIARTAPTFHRENS